MLISVTWEGHIGLKIQDVLNNPFCNDLSQNLSFGHLNTVTGQIDPKQNWPQVKTTPGQIVLSHIGPGSNRIIYIVYN